MLLFRPPVQTFGRSGVVPANFAAGSPLADDQSSLPDRSSAEFLWALLPPLPTGTTTAGDDGSYGLTGSEPGVQTQAYRGLVMPLSGDPIVYESEIVSGAAQVAAPFLLSSEQIWAPAVSVPSSSASVTVPSFDTTEEFGDITVSSTSAVQVVVSFLASGAMTWAPTVEGLSGGVDGSLITMEQADKYVLEFYGVDHAWFSVAASRKRIALRRATQYIQTFYCIKDCYLEPLHSNVIAAVAEAAIRALSGALFDDVGSQHVEEIEVGPIRRKMSAPRNSGQRRFAVIDQLLKGMTCKTAGMVKFERA